MKKFCHLLSIITLTGLCLLNLGAFAGGVQKNITVSPAAAKKVLESIRQARPDFQISEDVIMSPVAGLYQIQIVDGPVLYVSEDAKFLMAGNLFSIEPGKLVNLQEQAKIELRAKKLAELDRSKEIVFAPKSETKAVVHVFTDVDCGYCQKFHRQIASVNDLGIEVRYLAFPRAGIESTSAAKLATAWCADDPQATLTKLKNQEDIVINACKTNPVADQFQMGLDFGVNGTPAIVFEDGTMVPGYVPPQELAIRLGINR